MLVIGLTGGIGSGKSTVCALLAERGAVVIDTDLIAREVVEPGQPAHGAVLERFGPGVVDATGRIDRPALAEMVFADPSALADLNAIVHPAVRAAVGTRLEEEAATDHVVVVDVPLLVESASPYPLDAVLVVDCPEELAVARLVARRGMEEADARRRVAAQASRSERVARADFVILNDGSLTDLESKVAQAWSWIRSLPREKRPDSRPDVG